MRTVRFRNSASLLCLLGLIFLPSRSPAEADASSSPPVVKSEFVFEKAPFASCHASTIAEITNGLVAAWFGGTAEKNADVGIWLSRHDGKAWSAPIEVANGTQTGNTNRFPCWNPVLFQPRSGPLLLFYKVGPNPSRWWGMLLRSTNAGGTWSAPQKLPDGILGPIKNKPVELADGTLLCPSSTENAGWRIHLERTSDLGLTWTKTEPLNDGKEFGAIQPTIIAYNKSKMKLLCRSQQKVITECWTGDGGKTWSAMKASTLPNPNSGIDGIMLKNAPRALLVYNHTTTGRSPLNVAMSSDGIHWQPVLVLCG